MIDTEIIVQQCVAQILSEFHIMPSQLNPQTPIYGEKDGISSLALVRLIVDIEARVEEETGLSITLANDQVLSMTRSPFKNLGTLTQFVMECAAEAQKV